MLSLVTNNGITLQLPMFVPVYRPDYSFKLFCEEYYEHGLCACIVNAFLLYKDREKRGLFENGKTLNEYLGGFTGALITDSGAFQGLRRNLYLSNKNIVRFQNMIKSDIIAPLDLITLPCEKKTIAEQKMIVSHKRILEAIEITDYSILSGIQQGGRFFDLRQKHIRMLQELDMKYYGIGSLVPFLNKNHDLYFACKVIQDARAVIGAGKAMHVYGAGDPLELPFYYYAGANIFDSSSYAHYATGGFYMTPYGAINKAENLVKLEYKCNCSVCTNNSITHVLSTNNLLQLHNLYVIFETINRLRKISCKQELECMLLDIINRHSCVFPESKLMSSWEQYLSEHE